MSHTQTKYKKNFWKPLNKYIDELASQPATKEEDDLPVDVKVAIDIQRNLNNYVAAHHPRVIPDIVVGLEFKFKEEDCIITSLAPRSFFFEKKGASPTNRRIIPYKYWNKNVVARERGIKLKFIP